MIKARLRNYVSQLTIIIMPYMIFRVIFWLFIAVQVFLLLFCDKIDRYISPRALMVALVFKCAFVIAYIVYTNIAIDLPSPMFLNIIGYIFLFMLLIFIWRLYLSKTIKDDKTYQMVNLRRTSKNTHNIVGRIQEGKHIFEVLLKLSDKDFYKLDSQGYFDLMSRNKSVPVKLAKRQMDIEENEHYDAIVRLI